MIELITLVAGIVIAYSFVQGVRRGNLSDEERKKNPTVIESVDKFSKSALDNREKFEARAMKAQSLASIDREYFYWFRKFHVYVLKCFENAQEAVDREKELEKKSLRFREHYERSMTQYRAALGSQLEDLHSVSKLDQDWYYDGAPKVPEYLLEPELDVQVRQLHAKHLVEHEELVGYIKEKLSGNRKLGKAFCQKLSRIGLEAVFEDFFKCAIQSNPNNEADFRFRPEVKTVFSQELQSFDYLSPPNLPNLPSPIEIQTNSLNPLSAILAKAKTKHELHSISERIIEPSLNELDRLPTPLEDGERQVLAFFLEYLEPDWEIYIQPHLNGLRPDFVLLNPKVGIGVFEVKNWDFEAIKYFAKTVSNGQMELWARSGAKQFSKEHENPFRKISRYKQEIYDIYCPRLRSKAGFAAITGGVIFPSAPTKDVHALQKEFVIDTDNKVSAVYLPVCGREELLAKDMEKIFPEANRERSNLMTAALADDLRGWLVEPDSSKTQREPLPLDTRQRRLAETRTASGFRRIKGPAGSGKSIVLAARAARLASEGKSVLIVTFNITLWHYLRDMIRRDISSSKHMNNVSFTHFHMWCRNVCDEAGLGSAYANLFSEVRKLEASNKNSESNKQKIAELIGVIMDQDLPSLAITASLSPRATRYDAILVDEGQDFVPLWWTALKNCKKPDGEMMLVADTTQDIYDKSSSWTDEAMHGAGFSGEWSRLGVSYRLPQKALEAAQEFAKRYLPSDKLDLATTSAVGLEIEPCHLRWVQCSPDMAKKHCVDAILAMMRNTRRETGLAISDITFICNEISFGKSTTDELNTYTGVRTVNTFGSDRAEQVRAKMAFWMGDARIKATTLHSFKGWESRLLVVHVGNALGDENLASIYAALTRLKHSPLGSWLTVVCSTPELADYGSSWSKYATQGSI